METKPAGSLTHGRLGKQILAFSLPLMLSNVLQVLFNMSDIAVVGRFSGPIALGAVGSTATLVTLFTGFLIGLGSGINALVARFLGAGSHEETQRTVHTALALSLIFGAVLLLLGELTAVPLLKLLGTKEELIDGIPYSDWNDYIGKAAPVYLNDYSRMQLQHTKISLSFSALLFGPFYFFYRKAWKPAFAFLAAELLLFVPTLLQMMQITGSSLSLGLSDSTYVVLGRVVSLASFALMLVRGMFAKWFYRKSAAEHIRRIRAEFPDDAQRSVVLSAQGGVSWGAVLGSLLLLMVFGACCSMLLGPNLDVLLNALS